MARGTTTEPASALATTTNVVVLSGTVQRVDPWDEGERRLWRFEVITNTPTGPRERVPVSWSLQAQQAGVVEGDEVLVVGRVRTRFYRSGPSTQARTEVVADTVVAMTRRRAVQAATAAVAHHLVGGA